MITEILEANIDSDGFTVAIKGELKRYVVALTDNAFNNSTPLISTLENQIEAFKLLDNINIGGWINRKDNIKYIDISTSFIDEWDALQFAKIFNQKAIFDLETIKEILV